MTKIHDQDVWFGVSTTMPNATYCSHLPSNALGSPRGISGRFGQTHRESPHGLGFQQQCQMQRIAVIFHPML